MEQTTKNKIGTPKISFGDAILTDLSTKVIASYPNGNILLYNSRKHIYNIFRPDSGLLSSDGFFILDEDRLDKRNYIIVSDQHNMQNILHNGKLILDRWASHIFMFEPKYRVKIDNRWYIYDPYDASLEEFVPSTYTIPSLFINNSDDTQSVE